MNRSTNRKESRSAAAVSDPVDREVFLVRHGKPHCRPIAHLEVSHSIPATARHLLDTVREGRKDPDTGRILAAIRSQRDTGRNSTTFGCLKWYAEDAEVHDTNASFFTCTALVALWLGHRDELKPVETRALRGLFRDVLPWFRRMAQEPVLYYANKCISDAAMLLAIGRILGLNAVAEDGRAFCARYLDYCERRGVGGEDHSPVYGGIILDMTLLIMGLERSGPLYEQARRRADALAEWAAFHDGVDAVPTIRGYNFDCEIERHYSAQALWSPPGTGSGGDVKRPLYFAGLSGYRFRPRRLRCPRQRRWRTFDEHFSTSWIGPYARLGTLSEFPLTPNMEARDDSGIAWQSKPCAFIVGREEYGVLEWGSLDNEGVQRNHPAVRGYHDFDSRSLFKRMTFAPDVVTVSHQEGRAAIVLREVHRLHSPTVRLVDRWRLAHGVGQVLIGGRPWSGRRRTVPPGWIVLRYASCAVAIRPLMCRGLDAMAPADDNGKLLHTRERLKAEGCVGEPQLRIEKTAQGIVIENVLFEEQSGTVTQHLLFGGWCVVVLDKPGVAARLSVKETFLDDRELPRIHGETTRNVELQTPWATLRLTRDMLTGDVERWINGRAFSFRSSE
jgi:hypothetical protein